MQGWVYTLALYLSTSLPLLGALSLHRYLWNMGNEGNELDTLYQAFGTLGAQSLQEAAYASPRKVLFYASNCPSICVDIDALIEDAGFAPLYLGGLEHSIRLEVFGALHEFGALGKAVTLEEAKAQL